MKKPLIENLKIQISSIKADTANIRKQISSQSDEDIRRLLEQKLIAKEAELNELVEELDEVNNQKLNTAKADLIDLIEENKKAKPTHHMAYLSIDAKYILIRNYSTTEDRVNLTSQTLGWQPMIGVLNTLINKPGHFSQFDQDQLRTAFETAKASFLIRTASFDNPKWDPRYVFNTLEIQRKYWAPIDNGSEYNLLFDDLVYSLAGGKQENIEHIEKWVSYKYLNPDKNRITPGLNITGKPGGNGKGLFTQILTSIFTPMGVTVIKGKNLTGGFNAIMEGKVVTVLDDERKDRFPQDELKQNSGNGSIVIEPKGVDAYSVDSTANTIVLDNTGLVRLVGGGSGGEDRRWSIISTELTLLEILGEKYKLDESESKHLAEKMGELFANRIECGKWVAAMIIKHSMRDMPVLLPLHGEDYIERLLEQKDNYADIFERLLPIMVNQGLMPFKFLKEIVEAELGEKVRKPQTLSSKFDEFLSRKGHKNVEKTDVNIMIRFGNAISDKFKGAVRRLDKEAHEFDYELISSKPYNKKEILSRETLQIHDFAENNNDFADLQNLPRYPATPLKTVKTPLAATTDAVLSAGLKSLTPLTPLTTPLKTVDLTRIKQLLKEIKND